MRPAVLLTSLMLAFSVLMFGGVYPWTFWPIGALCVMVFALSWTRPEPAGSKVARTLYPCLLLLFVPWLLQLIPLPTSLVETVSPASVFFLRNDTSFRAGGWAHLSLAPWATVGGLMWAACLAMLFVGLVRTGDSRDFRLLAGVTTALGCVVAVVGLGQMGNPLIYGVWQPLGVTEAFGPFVNRNHFSGWMVLASALAAGLFGRSVGLLPRSAGRLKALSSNEGCQAMLLAVALLIMTTAIVASLSRSGLLAAVVACIVLLVFVVTKARLPVVPRIMGVLTVVAFLAVAALVVGPNAIAARLGSAPEGFASRLSVWTEASQMVRGFPVVGSGLGTFGLVFPHFRRNASEGFLEAHNDYLQVLVEGGLVATLAMLLLAGRSGVEALRYLRTKTGNDADWFRVGAMAGIAGIAVQETVDFSLRSPAVAVLFVVCCAAAIHPSGERT